MKILAENKKAGFDYQILEKFQAGIVLTGQEVKSVKSGRISIKGSYVVLRPGPKINKEEIFLIGANIPAYQPKNASPDYRAERSRKLLLNKREIKKLIGKIKEKGLTLVPLKVYTKNAIIKLEFGVGKGKKKADKREKIKKRDLNREIKRELKLRG